MAGDAGGEAALRVCAVRAPGFVGLFGEEALLGERGGAAPGAAGPPRALTPSRPGRGADAAVSAGQVYTQAWQLDLVKGFDMDLYRQVFKGLGRAGTVSIFQNSTSALAGLSRGTCDLVLGGIAIGEHNARCLDSHCVDFSHPYTSSSAALLHTRAPAQSLDLLEVFGTETFGNALAGLVAVGFLLGIVFWFVENASRGFSLRKYDWATALSKTSSWSFSIVTNVGIGSLPATAIGKLMAIVFCIISICISSIFGGIFTSTYVVQAMGASEPLQDVHFKGTKVCVADDMYRAPASKLTPLVYQEPSLEACVKRLLAGEVAAVMHDRLPLSHYVQRHGGAGAIGLTDTGTRYSVGIALPRNSTVRHALNNQIVVYESLGVIHTLLGDYFAAPKTVRANGYSYTKKLNIWLLVIAAACVGLFLVLWPFTSWHNRRSKALLNDVDDFDEKGEVEDPPASRKGRESPRGDAVRNTEDILNALTVIMKSSSQLMKKVDTIGGTVSDSGAAQQQQAQLTSRVVEMLETQTVHVHSPQRVGPANPQPVRKPSPAPAKALSSPQPRVQNPMVGKSPIPKLNLPGKGVQRPRRAMMSQLSARSYPKEDPTSLRARHGISPPHDHKAKMDRAMRDLSDINLVMDEEMSSSDDFSSDA